MNYIYIAILYFLSGCIYLIMYKGLKDVISLLQFKKYI